MRVTITLLTLVNVAWSAPSSQITTPDIKLASDADPDNFLAPLMEAIDPLKLLGQMEPQIEQWRAQVAATRARLEKELAAANNRALNRDPSSGDVLGGPDYVQPIIAATRESLTQLQAALTQIVAVNSNFRAIVSSLTRLVSPEGQSAEEAVDVGSVLISTLDEYNKQVKLFMIV